MSTDIHLSVDPSDLITSKGSLMLPMRLSTSLLVARKSRENKKKKKTTCQIRYPPKSFPACQRMPQLSMHQLINQYILSMLMHQIFTITDQQTLEHRQKGNNLDIDTMLSTLLTQYPNGFWTTNSSKAREHGPCLRLCRESGRPSPLCQHAPCNT